MFQRKYSELLVGSKHVVEVVLHVDAPIVHQSYQEELYGLIQTILPRHFGEEIEKLPHFAQGGVPLEGLAGKNNLTTAANNKRKRKTKKQIAQEAKELELRKEGPKVSRSFFYANGETIDLAYTLSDIPNVDESLVLNTTGSSDQWRSLVKLPQRLSIYCFAHGDDQRQELFRRDMIPASHGKSLQG